MPDNDIPFINWLITQAIIPGIKVRNVKVVHTLDNDSVVFIEARIGKKKDDKNKFAVFGVIYVLSCLSFLDARPQDVSGPEFDPEDDWGIEDMLRHLLFDGGELRFCADCVRGRIMKTTINVRPDGTFRLCTIRRGEAATRWIEKLQRKKGLRLVEEPPTPEKK